MQPIIKTFIDQIREEIEREYLRAVRVPGKLDPNPVVARDIKIERHVLQQYARQFPVDIQIPQNVREHHLFRRVRVVDADKLDSVHYNLFIHQRRDTDSANRREKF